jgi:hypothetical protein
MMAALRYSTLLALGLLTAAACAEETDPEAPEAISADLMQVVMHKNPGCGCCDIWADHLREHGFTVKVTEDPKVYDLKEARGIPQPLFSCHTAFVGDYFVEGHVPAQDILSLLRLKPDDVSGIAVPGMPLGSPGMEHPRPQSFNTIALGKDGDAYVFSSHAAGEDFSASDE